MSDPILSQRTLRDGSVVKLRYARSCGCVTSGCSHMRVGLCAVVVDLTSHSGTLRLSSGFRSWERTKDALMTCQTWHEVPLAIEAERWEVIP